LLDYNYTPPNNSNAHLIIRTVWLNELPRYQLVWIIDVLL